ncbi:hypothetical protein [Nannocystis sp. SCPEA4]|uniref:hypothetical protein n=1 Tax=Nannocystis sp. SCPEA4 TaxID=2996787 RepID=UPI00226EF5B8|nr:hypothetical protein [Nannocystis sp. SCPEA4]MCY1060351.1 hypothetical protein [Nannocystis sp. SCPEA4]
MTASTALFIRSTWMECRGGRFVLGTGEVLQGPQRQAHLGRRVDLERRIRRRP